MITRSSDVEESDFEGFNLEQMNGSVDESDVDLDLIVNNNQLLAKFESNSDSEQHDSENSEGSNVNLPTAAGTRLHQK